MTKFSNKVALLTAALGLISFTACTPTVSGQQKFNPIVKETPYASTRVLPGETVYVQYNYPRGYFDENDDLDKYFDGLNFDYGSVRGDGDKVPTPVTSAPWLKLVSTDAPTGVSVELVDAAIARPVTQTKVNGSSVNIKYREEFRLTYKISVSPTFKPDDLADSMKKFDPKTTGNNAIPNLTDVLLSNMITLKFDATIIKPEARLYLKYTK